MLKDFSQIIPQEICLSCDVCCRFTSEDCSFRPKVSDKERDNFDPNTLDDNYLKATDRNGMCKCVFFTDDDNTCQVYLKRPLECQIYPFLITEKDSKVFIAVHSTCPFVCDSRNTKEFDKWIGEIKRLFSRADVVNMFKRNMHLAGDYSSFNEELEYLFEVEL